MPPHGKPLLELMRHPSVARPPPFFLLSCDAETDSTRVLFHTPQGDTRAVIYTDKTVTPTDFTMCLWLRTLDTLGGIFSYSAPTSSVGLDFALYLTPPLPLA